MHPLQADIFAQKNPGLLGPEAHLWKTGNPAKNIARRSRARTSSVKKVAPRSSSMPQGAFPRAVCAKKAIACWVTDRTRVQNQISLPFQPQSKNYAEESRTKFPVGNGC